MTVAITAFSLAASSYHHQSRPALPGQPALVLLAHLSCAHESSQIYKSFGYHQVHLAAASEQISLNPSQWGWKGAKGDHEGPSCPRDWLTWVLISSSQPFGDKPCKISHFWENRLRQISSSPVTMWEVTHSRSPCVHTCTEGERGKKAQGEGSSMGRSFCFLHHNRFLAFWGTPGQPM